MLRVIKRSAGLAAAALLVLCSGAEAQVKDSNGQWAFTGSTYRKATDPPAPAQRADPISVIWLGPAGASVTVRKVEDHTSAHWTARRIPDGFPKADTMAVRNAPWQFACRDAHFVFMRTADQGPNDGAWGASTGYMSTSSTCRTQYHLRLWSSAAYADANPGSADAGEWVLAPIHHEHPIVRCVKHVLGVCVLYLPDHQIDLEWDQARYIYFHVMTKVHCGDLQWDYNPESTGYQYGSDVGPYSGLVSRISLQHRSEGCTGA
jgi:hypothetical protein